MDQSVLLSDLVVRAAAVALLVLLLRLVAGAALAALARVSSPLRSRRLAALALRVGPRFARGSLAAVAGLGIAVSAGPGAALASDAPHVPVLDRAVVLTAPASPAPPATSPVARPTSHVVRSGESLWSIAADALPGTPTTRAIASHWPRWYTANRGEIGPDPGRIRPGQVLRAPAGDAR